MEKENNMPLWIIGIGEGLREAETLDEHENKLCLAVGHISYLPNGDQALLGPNMRLFSGYIIPKKATSDWPYF